MSWGWIRTGRYRQNSWSFALLFLSLQAKQAEKPIQTNRNNNLNSIRRRQKEEAKQISTRVKSSNGQKYPELY